MGLINDAPQQKDLDPKEVEQFKSAYQLSKQFLYQEQVFDKLMQSLGQEPAKAMADLIVSVMLKVQDEVGPMSLSVAAMLGIALFDDLSTSLEETGALENSPELQQQLIQEALPMWLQANSYSAEEIEQLLSDMGATPEMIQQAQGPQQAPQQPQQAPPLVPQQ